MVAPWAVNLRNSSWLSAFRIKCQERNWALLLWGISWREGASQTCDSTVIELYFNVSCDAVWPSRARPQNLPFYTLVFPWRWNWQSEQVWICGHPELATRLRYLVLDFCVLAPLSKSPRFISSATIHHVPPCERPRSVSQEQSWKKKKIS